MERLAKHYAAVSHVSRKKWTTKDFKTALHFDTGKKVGRKSKKKSKAGGKKSRKRKRGQ